LSLITSVLCLCAALALTFWAMFQLDVRLARWIQDINAPWFETVGRAGQLLGDWRSLLGISGALLAAGWMFDRPAIRRLGLDTLVAHGMAALAVQTLKHALGRPRPRLTHTSNMFAGPSFESGMDSFPSGHTTASCAIAVVVARSFPSIAWLPYGVAAVIAASRVIHGSHFPADVLAGVVLGILVGFVSANGLAEWRASLTRGLLVVAPMVVVIGIVCWTTFQPAVQGARSTAFLVAGAAMIVLGLAVRLGKFRSRVIGTLSRWSPALCGGGLGLTTASWLNVTGATLLGIAYSVMPRDPDGVQARDRRLHPEVAIALAFLVAVLALQGLKGLRPLL
jgi:undecaprenyl-diphosphatase